MTSCSNNPWFKPRLVNKTPDNVLRGLEDPEEEEEEKVKKELSEEEREAIRVKRRIRRKMAKESKKLLKQQKIVENLRAPKNSKLSVIQSLPLPTAIATVNNSTSVNITSPVFRPEDEEEYPTLGLEKKKKIEKKPVAVPPEMETEWETEEEDADENKVYSYSSILKNKNVKKAPKKISVPPPGKPVKEEAVPAKKVKKKDPIMFDLFSAIQQKNKNKEKEKNVKKSSAKKVEITTLTKKIQTRGKEREKPKKKQKSTLKKIILAEREVRRQIRMKALIQKSAVSINNNDDNKDVIKDATEKEISEPITLNDSNVSKAKTLIHSRRFRDYCDHDLCPKVNEYVTNLLQDIIRFQDRLHENDPVKAKIKRRYVIGLREVKKFMTVKKITLLIMAPDVEPITGKGGLNDFIGELKRLGELNNIPIVYAHHRRKLGYICYRKVAITCIGILNYHGSDDNFKGIMELLPDLKSSYDEKLSEALKKVSEGDSSFASSSSFIKEEEKKINISELIVRPEKELADKFLNLLKLSREATTK